jgi:tRNA dimethylallyltransferase
MRKATPRPPKARRTPPPPEPGPPLQGKFNDEGTATAPSLPVSGDHPPPSVASDSAIYLAGPTGSGKSGVALALARRIGNAAIVNADAFQLYRGIERLSAAPDMTARAEIPHFLYGVLELSESCDAARYASLARAVIDDLAARGLVPIVVGGSGLYLKSLTHGLAPTPPGDPALREMLGRLDLDTLVAWLTAIDPAGAASTNLKNRRYVTRNLEISLLSGVPASGLKRAFVETDPKIRGVVLSRVRTDLYRRIDARAAALFREGVIAEVSAIDPAALSPTSAKAIGLREIQALIAGHLSEPDCVAAIARATRRYAKRQETWFRREKAFQSVCLPPAETPDSASERILGLFSQAGISNPSPSHARTL